MRSQENPARSAGMGGLCAPGHPFHVRHLCALVDYSNGMMHLFFQLVKTKWETVTGSSSADALNRAMRHTSAINITRCSRVTLATINKRSLRRALRFPKILTLV